MKRNILYLFTGLVFFIISCKKEKFENEGVYTGEFVSSIHYQDSIYHTTTHVMVELRNETITSIEYDGFLLEKNGRKITGILPIGALWDTKEVVVKMTRDLFSEDINGTYTTETMFFTGFQPTTGTITLEHQ